MLAIGGVIGPGYFVGMGTGLTSAGPAGLLLCFTVVGVLLWAVMQSLGELGAFIPLSGSFTHYTSTFVDPAVGFALGWNYWLLWAGIIIAEYNNLGLVLTYWETAVPRWGWILIFWWFFLAFTLLGVKSFGEAEFWLALVKILAIFAFFLCAILITSGVLGGEKIGFKFYHDPGAFADGAKGVFKVFVFAALQYSGTEMIGLTAGESANPARDVPKAVKSVLWRICGIFLLGIFFLTITVPYNDPNLLSATSKTARSPFVIAFTRVGANAGAHVVNAIILVTMFSAINAALYVGSRTLYGLAQEGQAPKIFAWTNKNGVPVVSLVVMNLIGFLSLLNLSSGAGVVYTWIISITGVATFITWGLISLNHIRLRMALAAQNISADVLPFQAPAWRFCAYLGLAGNVFFIFFQGWTSFAPWDVEAFFQNYVVVLLFIILAVGWKFAKKTKFVNLKEIDLGSARMVIHGQMTGQPQ
ncbi:General amino acid permease AGP3 [Colletotrichum fructicola Nara gc5]|nr:General amino acid permease AGP3 [Colletotrichum fructicola Nara gc5]